MARDALGNIYVSDAGAHTVRRLSRDDLEVAGAIDGVGAAARFAAPVGLAFDTADNLYVADSGNHTVRRIGQDGTVHTVLGRAGQAGIVLGAAPAGLDTPYQLAWTADGLVVVSKQAVLIAATK